MDTRVAIVAYHSDIYCWKLIINNRVKVCFYIVVERRREWEGGGLVCFIEQEYLPDTNWISILYSMSYNHIHYPITGNLLQPHHIGFTQINKMIDRSAPLAKSSTSSNFCKKKKRKMTKKSYIANCPWPGIFTADPLNAHACDKTMNL